VKTATKNIVFKQDRQKKGENRRRGKETAFYTCRGEPNSAPVRGGVLSSVKDGSGKRKRFATGGTVSQEIFGLSKRVKKSNMYKARRL